MVKPPRRVTAAFTRRVICPYLLMYAPPTRTQVRLGLRLRHCGKIIFRRAFGQGTRLNYDTVVRRSTDDTNPLAQSKSDRVRIMPGCARDNLKLTISRAKMT